MPHIRHKIIGWPCMTFRYFVIIICGGKQTVLLFSFLVLLRTLKNAFDTALVDFSPTKTKNNKSDQIETERKQNENTGNWIGVHFGSDGFERRLVSDVQIRCVLIVKTGGWLQMLTIVCCRFVTFGFPYGVPQFSVFQCDLQLYVVAIVAAFAIHLLQA